MKRTIFGIVGFFALLLASSAFTERVTAPAVGYMAPALSVSNDDSTEETASLSALRGSYVLLSFWDSSRADSRLAMNQYQHWFDSHLSSGSDQKIAMIGVNLDSNTRMFEEIVKRDRLDRANQFNLAGEKASFVVENFQLSDQPKSFLIDPEGRIIAINPTPDQLDRI